MDNEIQIQGVRKRDWVENKGACEDSTASKTIYKNDIYILNGVVSKDHVHLYI